MFAGNLQYSVSLYPLPGYTSGDYTRTRSILHDGNGYAWTCMAVNGDYVIAKVNLSTQVVTVLGTVVLNNTYALGTWEWWPLVCWNSDKTKMIVLVPKLGQYVYDIYEYVLATDTATLKSSDFIFHNSLFDYDERVNHLIYDPVLGKALAASYQGGSIYALDLSDYSYSLLTYNLGTPGHLWPTYQYIYAPFGDSGPSSMGGIVRYIRNMGYHPEFVAGIVRDDVPTTVSPCDAHDVLLYNATAAAAFENGRVIFPSYDGLWLKNLNGIATRFDSASQGAKTSLCIQGETLLCLRGSYELRYYT